MEESSHDEVLHWPRRWRVAQIVMPPRMGVLLLVAGLLNACISDARDTLACPSVQVLQDLDVLTRFNPGARRDPTDVQIEAWINRVTGECTLDDADLLVELVVEISTRRGPANKFEKADISYIVAIADADRKILSRRAFVATAPYIGRKTISFSDALSLNIPIARGVEGDAFTVYVGLSLSETELRYNRSRAKR